VRPGESRINLYVEISAAKLWAPCWVTGHKCLSQEMGPRESGDAGEVLFCFVFIPVAAAQCKCKLHLGILSVCVLIHAPQLLNEVLIQEREED